MNFEEIYTAHSKMVFNLALQYVQNIEDAEEITQDVFVSIHQSYSGFKEESSVKTWIYRITINKSLDHIRSKQRKRRFAFFTSLFFEGSNTPKHETPSFDHPGILMEDKESINAIFQKINGLPDNQKTALILHKIEQKTQAEVGEIMNLSTKAVESLIQRAKAGLLKKMDDTEGSESKNRLNQ